MALLGDRNLPRACTRIFKHLVSRIDCFPQVQWQPDERIVDMKLEMDLWVWPGETPVW